MLSDQDESEIGGDLPVGSAETSPPSPDPGLIALGSWHTFDRMTWTEGLRLLGESHDLGVKMFDVGVYGDRSDDLALTDLIFGALVRASGIRRDEFLYAIKLWRMAGYPEISIRSQVEFAIRRTGLDAGDVVVLGDLPAGASTAIPDIVGQVADVIQRGLARSWALNNWAAMDAEIACREGVAAGIGVPAFVQLKYSVVRRTVVRNGGFDPLFRRGMGLQSSDVFEGGLLLGKGSGRREVGRDVGDVQHAIPSVLPHLRDFASSVGASVAQVCLAFALAHPASSGALIGCSSVEQLRDNIGAVALLRRIGASKITAELEELWLDRGIDATAV